MKLKNFIFSFISGALLCSCSVVYEDLDPCPQGADVRLTFCNNMQGTDQFNSAVHCAKLLVYDGEGNFFGEYEYNGGNTMGIALPAGTYHAVAYGGMSCDDADVTFSNSISDPHHYSSLETYILGSRVNGGPAVVEKNLHSHFHGVGDFTVTDEDLNYIAATIDLTKNTNNFRVVLRYSDGSEINPSDFDYSLTADNAVTDHANKIKKWGQAVTYKPYSFGSTRAGDPSANADLCTGRLEADLEARLTVTPKSGGDPSVDINLIKYLEKIKDLEVKGGSLQDYLDRQDNWTLEFTLDSESEKIDGLTIKINNWEIILNEFDL